MPHKESRGNILISLLAILVVSTVLVGTLYYFKILKKPTSAPSLVNTRVSVSAKDTEIFKASQITNADIISYLTVNGDYTEVWSMTSKGTDNKKFIWSDNPTRFEAFKWSPDGKYLAFFADYSKNFNKGLYIYNTVTNQVKLIESLYYQHHHAENRYIWSNDSKYFIYVPFDCSTALSIYNVDEEKRYDLNVNENECVGGPIEALSTTDILLYVYTSSTYCKETSTNYSSLDKSQTECYKRLLQLNLRSLEFAELVKIFNVDGGINYYIYNPHNNSIIIFDNNLKVSIFDLSSKITTQLTMDTLDTSARYLNFVSLKSPNLDKVLLSRNVGMGQTRNYLLDMSSTPIKTKRIFVEAPVTFEDWLSQDEIIYADYESNTINILNLVDMSKKELLDIAQMVAIRQIK